MKYNMVDIYNGRIEDIDKQLKVAVFKKKWTEVKQLREERKHLYEKIKTLEAKEA